DPAWNFSRQIIRQDPLAYFNKVLDTKTVGLALATLGPQNPYYRRFQNGLKEYRAIVAAGGWPTVSTGPVLSVGSTGPRVEQLRQRLKVTGDLPGPDPANPSAFNEELEAAVEHFQIRHGIDADGKAGPRTIEEMNVPVETRINQFRASLERMRWVFRDLPARYLIVDVAGFSAYLMENGEKVWGTRVQVGKPYHATPVFKDTMRYIDFNPTWTIPPGILRKETLPRVRRDPEYLSRNNMSVVTTSGKIVDPSTIDWAATTKGFPYMIRTERAFSHGCIRTQNPFDLAEILLADQGWDRAKIDQVVASKKTTRVNLDNPITVMLLYWTAEVGDDGTVHFRKDVYNRDAPIIKGLDVPFRVSLPEGAREAFGYR
ncbi:MAG: L,D-transpeptidase family protein, partial [Acidobacteria bacterium]|nr:L,D-transpeptidase family protein [Candidatus Sulfomarinibacter kjeldsenii]